MTQRHWIQNNAIMFITTCTHKREPLFINHAYAREAVECLYKAQANYPFDMYAFVIMPDHCHFLLWVPEDQSISKIMNVYKSLVRLNTGLQKVWQRRFYQQIPINADHAIKYIHNNPVKANLAATAEAYPWSSASGRWPTSPIPF